MDGCNSDRGLAGAFNANIVKAARLKAEELQAQGKTVLFFLVGRKGRAVISRVFPRQTIAQYDTTGIRDIGCDEAQEIAAEVRELFDQGKKSEESSVGKECCSTVKTRWS